MALKLNGSTDGSVSLDAPADTSPTGTDITLTLPTSAGSSGQYLQTNGSGTLSWQTVTDTNTQGYTFLQAGTMSGNSSITVDSIPTSSTEIVILIRDVSNNDATGKKIRLRLGNGSIDSANNYTYSIGAEAVGYSSTNAQSYYLATVSAISGAANSFDGIIWCTRMGASGQWVIASSVGEIANNNPSSVGGGSYAVSTAIDRVNLSCNGGTYDSGSFFVGYK